MAKKRKKPCEARLSLNASEHAGTTPLPVIVSIGIRGELKMWKDEGNKKLANQTVV